MVRILTILILIHCVLSGSGQLIFDSDFENARLDTTYMDSGAYILSPVVNLHFRITGAISEKPVFKIYDSVGYQLRSYHYMVYRYEGENEWLFFDTAYKSGTTSFYHFYNNSPFIQDTVYIAYWFPYTYTNLKEYIFSIRESQFIHNAGSKGKSYEGRNLYGYEVSDTSYSNCYKTHIVIIARQHPIESINGYFVEGLTNYLINSNDSLALFLRRNHRFFVYPMLNPDGVYNGSGQNALGQGLNREWEAGLTPSGTPEVDTIRPIIWEETEHRVDIFIDIHSNPGNNLPYYWWGYTSQSPVPSWQIEHASSYVHSVSEQDMAISGISLFQNYIQGNGVSASMTAANWFTNTFNAISFTFEPTSEPMGYMGDNRISIARLREAGSSLGKGFYIIYDTVQSLTGSISTIGSTLIAHVDGGVPPYTYLWSGPVTGDSDTLVYATPGDYFLNITDFNGCIWNGSVTIEPNAIWNQNRVTNALLIAPNPTDGIVTIQTIDEDTIVDVLIYNFAGELIFLENQLGRTNFQFDASGISDGIYLISIRGEDFIYNGKFFKL